MISAFFLALFIPAILAPINRFARGEGKWKRWQWYGFITLLSGFVSFDSKFAIIFLLIALGYALFPWQAMFSAFTGKPPGRKDHWIAQWMQNLTHAILSHWYVESLLNAEEYPIYYKRFGMIYGAIRGALTIPGILMMCGYTKSWIPLIGILFLGMGVVYFLAGKLCMRFELRESMAVPFAETFMGWWLGTYLLICVIALWTTKTSLFCKSCLI